MTQDQKEAIYRKLFTKFGSIHQHIKLIEELSELSAEVAKRINGTKDSSLENMFSEIADVKIMIEQIEFIHENGKNLLNKHYDYKLNRLESYL